MLHVPVFCINCHWFRESELTQKASAMDLDARTFVAYVPERFEFCEHCQNEAMIVPMARYESHGGETHAYQLGSPSPTERDLHRRRALLEAQQPQWHDARVLQQLGKRQAVLENLEPRVLDEEERKQIFMQFRPSDTTDDATLVSSSVETNPDLTHVLPSIAELLLTVPELGVRTIADQPIHTGVAATMAGQGLIGARRLTRFRLGICEDQLAGMAAAIQAGRASACFAIARSCTELGGGSLWMLEPSDLRLVTARYFADRWNGLKRLAVMRPEEEVALLAQVSQEATELESEGFSVGRHRQTGWPESVEGEGKINWVEAVASAFPERDMGTEAYRMLSAMVHGTEYGLNDLISRNGAEEALSLSQVQIAHVIRLALRPYGVALHQYAHIGGHDVLPALLQIDEAFASVEILVEAWEVASSGSSIHRDVPHDYSATLSD